MTAPLLRKLLFLAAGIALFAFVLHGINLQEVIRQTLSIGWGALVLLALYFVSFLADAIAWQITLRSVPLTWAWLYRIWKVRMVGEALNLIIPAAGLGGEPMKAIMLRRHYDIDYRDGIASLILNQTIITFGFLLFLFIGFALMLNSEVLPKTYYFTAGVGLLGLTIVTFLIILIQYLRPSSFIFPWMYKLRIGARLERSLKGVKEIENELVIFYTTHRKRFFSATLVCFIPWLIGVPEIYYAAYFLGHPISFTDAWIIEAAVQLIRAGAFFLPAGLGAQEGIFLLLVSALTGSPTLGIALAMVRRFREVVWISWGLGIGLLYSKKSM